jgi:hypothetical protein
MKHNLAAKTTTCTYRLVTIFYALLDSYGINMTPIMEDLLLVMCTGTTHKDQPLKIIFEQKLFTHIIFNPVPPASTVKHSINVTRTGSQQQTTGYPQLPYCTVLYCNKDRGYSFVLGRILTLYSVF